MLMTITDWLWSYVLIGALLLVGVRFTIGARGVQIAVPIWIDFMKAALQGMPERIMHRPDGIEDRLINKTTGAPATPGEPDTMFEYFRTENAPTLDGALLPGIDPASEESEELSTETIF